MTTESQQAPAGPELAEEARYASLPHALWWGNGWWRAGRKISETLNLSDRKQRARFKKSSARWRAAMMRQGAAKHAAERHNRV